MPLKTKHYNVQITKIKCSTFLSISVHELPGVGKNLQNHVAYFTNFYINDSDTSALNWATAMEYLLFRDGLMSGTGISDVTAKLASKYAEDPKSPDLVNLYSFFLKKIQSINF